MRNSPFLFLLCVICFPGRYHMLDALVNQAGYETDAPKLFRRRGWGHLQHMTSTEEEGRRP